MAQLKDLVVNGVSRLIGDTFMNKAQISSISALDGASSTTYGIGTSGQFLRSNSTNIYWSSLSSSDLPKISITDGTTGTLTVPRGGTGNTTMTANRLVYCETANAKLSTTNHYSSNNKIAINNTTEPTETLYVNGNTKLAGTVETTGKIKLSGTSSSTAVIEFSRTGVSPYNYITVPTNSQLAIAIGEAGGANTRLAISDSSVNPTLSSTYTIVSSLGNSDTPWKGVYSGNLTLGGTKNTDSGKTLSSSDALYLNRAASKALVFKLGNNENASFTTAGHFIPGATNTYSLGIAGTARWKNLYVGTADSYGGANQPIYWNAGVPKAITYTTNRLYYPSATTAVTAGTHYINNTSIAINTTTKPTVNLYVNGTSHFTNNITLSDADIGISRTGRSMAWNKGRDGALIKTTTISGYSPFASILTTNGFWDIGTYDSSSYYDDLIFSYIPNSLYEGTNTTPTQIKFLENGHIVASLDGNASTASKLSGSKTITLSGAVTGSGAFDGSANLTISTSVNHNHDSIYLKKAGDSMTGALTIKTIIGTSNETYGTTLPTAANSTTGQIFLDTSTGSDYAEYRECNEVSPGRCVVEVGDDTLTISTTRMQPGAQIISDTYGDIIGAIGAANVPIGLVGRILAYPYEDREEFKNYIGHPVCSGPNGTVSIMTDEEYKDKGYCAIGYISAVPDYETWGDYDIKIDGRVWIRIK